MKVIGISGSTRKGGNTANMIGRVFEKLEAAGVETELIELVDEELGPCHACWGCGGMENCVYANDAFHMLFEAIKKADGIVLGSPSYSANISSRMQALLERASVVADMNPGLLDGKVGAAVAPARRAGALHVTDAINHFFLNHGMYVVGSSYWNVAYGRMPGDVKEDVEGMATMDALGENMARILKALA